MIEQLLLFLEKTRNKWPFLSLRTIGKAARNPEHDNVIIVSGEKLVELLDGTFMPKIFSGRNSA